MTDLSAITNLKRKIVATDKLVKHKTKTENKNTELTKLLAEKDKILEEQNKQIAKLEADLCQSLVSNSSDNNELEQKLAESNKLVDDTKLQVEGLKYEVKTNHQKINQLEADKTKVKSKVEILEKELKSKNENIVQREMESQKLKQQIENLENRCKQLEEESKTGKHLEDIKSQYEETKWKNLAEISSLKQEKFQFERQFKELKEANELLEKSKIELLKQVEAHNREVKLSESLERTIEKKDKSFASLEKKLEHALKVNEGLKSKLRSKGQEIPSSVALFSPKHEENLEDESINDKDDDVDNDSQGQVDDYEEHVNKNYTPRLSLSFSLPNARFVIGKPKLPKVSNKFKLVYNHQGSFVENIPEVFNVLPKISDHYSRLSFTSNKRKLHHDQSRSSPKVKRKKSDIDESRNNLDLIGSPIVSSKTSLTSTISSPILESLKTPTRPSSKSSKRQRSKSPAIRSFDPSHNSTVIDDKLKEEPGQLTKPKPVKPRQAPGIGIVKSSHQTSPACPEQISSGFLPGHSSTLIEEKPKDDFVKFTEPRPVRSRQAHGVARPSPQNPPPRFEPRKKKEKTSLFPSFKLPAQLSPIRSPKVELPKSPPSFPSPVSLSSSPGSVRERIKATSLTPVQVEAPVKAAGGKLNAVQLEAARRRAVPSSATTLAPSVDGFRQSSVKLNPTKAPAASATKGSKKAGKMSEELLYCPTRKRTNPSKVTSDETSKPLGNDLESRMNVKEDISPSGDSVIIKKETKSDDVLEDKIDEKPPVKQESESNLGNNLSVLSQEKKISGKETLIDDLSVSDSDEEENNVVDSNEFQDEDDEKKERFDKLKSENSSKERQLDTNVTNTATSEPIPKPVNHKTLLEELNFHYKIRSDEMFKELKLKRDKLSQERSELLYDETVNCLRKQFRNLMGSQNEASFDKLVGTIASSNNPQSESMICDLVYEYLKSEHRDTPLLSASNPDQPPITRKQQRLFVLLTVLSKEARYAGIMERMILLLWHNLFGRDRMYNLKLNAVQNCGRMFVLCARFSDNITIVRHFVYDLFYFKSPRNHVLVGIVVALWPEVFPPQDSEMAKTPIMETIVWCVFNTDPATFSREMMVYETKENFEKDYGYKANSIKAEELVKNFIKLAGENDTNKDLLDEITKSLLLLGRCKDFRWVNNNLVTRLMKSLESFAGNPHYLTWVIFTIGLVCRVYTAEGRESVRKVFDSVQALLAGDNLSQQSEDSYIQALMHLGYHLQTQVAQFLKTWKPRHSLSSDTRRLMEDFVGTRGKKYAQITAHVAQIERTNARKKKGLKRK